MKYLLVLVLLASISYAKKDFYYSYIDDNKEQLEQSVKDKILQINSKIIYINKLIRDSQISQAYKQILLLRDKNKIKVLKSSIELLYAKILYLRQSKKFSVEANRQLNKSINESIINQNDLLDALKLLVKINIKINKSKEAKFVARNILDTFKDPLGQAYGKISMALVDVKQRRYKRAIKILYKILIKTKNLEVATIVSDELFDAYILDKQYDKAYALTTKVLDKNMNYYSSNSHIAMIKINKLIKAKMPLLAIKILKNLLKSAKQQKHINNFKFKLANIYMSIGSKDNSNLIQAKELYKDLIRQKNNKANKDKSKMYLDEILMRQGIITPQIVTSKYANSKSMYQKTLLQELLNYKKLKDYENINKLKNVYLKIDSITTKRFGYKSVEDIFDIINSDMLKDYLDDSKCKLLDTTLKTIKKSALKKLIQDEKANDKLFDCMLEYPNKESFEVANDIYANYKDYDIYFKLEQVAIKLNLNKEAYTLSQKIFSSNEDKIKSDEFLYKFLIYAKQNNSYSMDKFFDFAIKNKDYVINNENNPVIIDFYYQFYLYLIKKHKSKQAVKILQKLNDKQNDMDAHIYSPFVEMQIAQNKVLDDDYNSSIEYLNFALENTRNIKNNDLVKIYYEMAKSYKKLNKINRYKDAITKCKSVKDVKTLYKSMCDRL